MALKYAIDIATFGTLPAPVQAEYKKNADGTSYTLDVSDLENHASEAVKNAKNHEKEQRQQLQAKHDELQTKYTEFLKGNVPKTQLEALEDSFKTQRKEFETEYKTKLKTLEDGLTTTHVTAIADGIAKEISTAPTLLAPRIAARLKAEIVEGKAVTKVVDKDGKPSVSTLEDLKKEILANPEYKTILIASKGSGGSAGGAGGGRASAGNSAGGIDFTKTPEEIRAAIRLRDGVPDGVKV